MTEDLPSDTGFLHTKVSLQVQIHQKTGYISSNIHGTG